MTTDPSQTPAPPVSGAAPCSGLDGASGSRDADVIMILQKLGQQLICALGPVLGTTEESRVTEKGFELCIGDRLVWISWVGESPNAYTEVVAMNIRGQDTPFRDGVDDITLMKFDTVKGWVEDGKINPRGDGVNPPLSLPRWGKVTPVSAPHKEDSAVNLHACSGDLANGGNFGDVNIHDGVGCGNAMQPAPVEPTGQNDQAQPRPK